MMPVSRVTVRAAGPGELAEPLALLQELSDGKPVPASFVEQVEKAVQRGDLELLVARTGTKPVGVAVLAFRLGISAGVPFASIEDLYVEPDARRQGVGRKLLEAVGERCKKRGVSYVEVQADDEAVPFYEALNYEPESDVRVLSHSIAF